MIYSRGRSVLQPVFFLSGLIAGLFFAQRDEPLCNYFDTHVRRLSQGRVMKDIAHNKHAQQLSEQFKKDTFSLNPKKDNLYGIDHVHEHVDITFKNGVKRYYSPVERSLTFTSVTLKLLLKGVLGV